jgi:hypothetical protein
MQIKAYRRNQSSYCGLAVALAALIAAVGVFGIAHAASTPPIAFPGALGWAAQTVGGRGGKIIRVTTLAADGPGSFVEAIQTKGPRIVVFEVGGIIDLQQRELKITEPFLTIAGQTAPSPGITLIKTGIDLATHDVIMQHMKIRTGTTGAPETPTLNTSGAVSSARIVK